MDGTGLGPKHKEHYRIIVIDDYLPTLLIWRYWYI